MVLNKWLSIFMPYLRRFCCNDDMAFIDNEILKEFGIACSNVYVFYKATKKNILLVTLKNVFQIYGLMDLAKTGQGLRFMFMTYFVICKKVGVWEG